MLVYYYSIWPVEAEDFTIGVPVEAIYVKYGTLE